MANAKLAFYVAKNGNWVDKLIAWYTHSQYSHVELIHNGYWYSTSPRDLEVRRKTLRGKEGHWVYKDVEIDLLFLEDFFFLTKGKKYDWLGIAFSVGILYNLRYSFHSKNRYFCSEFVATILKIERPDKYSPEKLYRYLEYGELA